MADSREKILASIRRGLRTSEKFDAKRDAKSPLKSISKKDFDSLFKKFDLELKKLGGEAIVFADEESAGKFVADHAGESTFVCDKSAPWYVHFAKNHQKPVQASLDFDFGYDKRKVAIFDSAVSPCVACVAETGTVVIANVMRLPPALATRLFIIAEPGKLIPSLDELFSEDHKKFPGSNLFLITGSSRTADIEKELVTGVHGPKEIYVIFISRSPQ